MKIIFTITLILAITLSTIIGCAAIFDFLTVEEAKALALKSLAAIVLLGGASATVAMLTGSKKTKT